jgi:hypothetical protein
LKKKSIIQREKDREMGVFEIRISMKKKRERERERERERGEMEVFEKKSNTQREREREAHLEPSTRRSLNPKYSETLSSSTSSSSTFTRKYSQMPGLGRIANPTHGGDTMASWELRMSLANGPSWTKVSLFSSIAMLSSSIRWCGWSMVLPCDK